MASSLFASNLTALRNSHSYTVAELSMRSAIDSERLTLLETDSSTPTPSELLQLCAALSTGLDRLLRYDLAAIDKLRSQSDIRFLALDVDGVMTDGGVYYAGDGSISRKFNVKDGVAISRLTARGFQVGFISAGSSVEHVQARARRLHVQRVACDVKIKSDVLLAWCDELKITPINVAYIGDDRNDLEPMAKVGIAACPADAVDEVKAVVDWILETKGGSGCVREFVDLFLSP